MQTRQAGRGDMIKNVISRAQDIKKFTLYDHYSLQALAVNQEAEINFFTIPQGDNISTGDAFTGGTTKTFFSTNITDRKLLNKGNVAIVKRIIKTYVMPSTQALQYASAYQDAGGNLYGNPKQLDNLDVLQTDIAAVEGAVGGRGARLEFYRGGEEIVNFRLPLYRMPSGSVPSNNGYDTELNAHHFDDQTAIYLGDNIDFSAKMLFTGGVNIPSGSNIVIGVWLEGVQFKLVYPEGMDQDAFRDSVIGLNN